MPGWSDLSATWQDALICLALLGPGVVAGLVVLRGFAPWALVAAFLCRFVWTNLLFVILIAASVALGIGLVAQERALRMGGARATDKFDLIISAPDSELSVTLAAVFLQPTQLPLLDGSTFAEIEASPGVALAAPLVFGDRVGSAPIVGTTAAFVDHLAGPIAEGRVWQRAGEAIVGATVPLTLGDGFVPAHGYGEAADQDAHKGAPEHRVVGRMAATGTPWDRAVLLPIESVWQVHGLATGHAPDRVTQMGPPFDAAFMPGVPVVVVKAASLPATYAVQSLWQSDTRTMAVFPGAVLSGLYRVMGDVRVAMSAISSLAQGLVAASILAGLLILLRLLRRQMMLLRVLGAPARFVLAVVWSYCALLLAIGTLVGLAAGVGLAAALSVWISGQTGVVIYATISWTELHLTAAFLSVVAVLSLLPGWVVSRNANVADLRL